MESWQDPLSSRAPRYGSEKKVFGHPHQPDLGLPLSSILLLVAEEVAEGGLAFLLLAFYTPGEEVSTVPPSDK